MIETSLSAWAWMSAAILITSLSGLSLVRLVPWTSAARKARIPLAFGLAIAPLLLGLLSTMALGLFPGKSHSFHLTVVFIGLLAMWPIGLIARPDPQSRALNQNISCGFWCWIFVLLLAAWVIGLLVDSLFMPLTQNDSLEYATVGRLLFELRSLSAYPALDPTAGNSGFYGPWTHPPLYPSLIYLTNVLQGHADSPGLMRLIAPWFALSTTGLVLTLGYRESFTTGVIAALLFLSVPLFYLGVGSALLDSLPVQGLTLILCAVVGVNGKAEHRGIVIGLTLGAAMWTHSQAVLFLPLAIVAICFHTGWRNPRFLLKQIIPMIVSAGLVAAWPYYRNLELFGAVISDNPAVFALKELGWSDYFSLARGLESWTNKIQYGLFKGWFALEAYSISFWLMLIGVFFYLRQLLRQHLWLDWLRGDMERIPQRWKNTMLGVIMCYLSGVLLSILMGIDLMIKNERYLLVLMPCVAIFAGSGIGQLVAYLYDHSKIEGRVLSATKKFSAAAILLLIISVFAAQLLAVGSHRWRTFGLSLSQIGLSPEEKILRWPAHSVIRFLKTHTPKTATVFSLKPADMYYAQRRMLSYLDPRLLSFYRTGDIMKAYHQLVNLGIDYVHVPDYSLPPMYNSVLQEILARPDLVRLLHSAGGHQIYELVRSNNMVCGQTVDLSPGSVLWTRINQFIIGGRKKLYKVSLAESAIDPNSPLADNVRFPFFHRDISTGLICETINLEKHSDRSINIAGQGIREYRLDLDMEGHAYAQVSLMQFNTSGRQTENNLLGEIALGQHFSKQRFTRRFVASPDTASIRVLVEHLGKTKLHIRRAVIVRICNF